MEWYNTKEQIKKWIDRYYVKNYTISDDLIVDVDYSIDMLVEKPITHLPFQFGYVNGDFDMENHSLRSLKGVPHAVEGYFDVRGNNLNSLQYFPKEIGGWVNVSGNRIKSLDQILSSDIGNDVICHNNKLSTIIEYIDYINIERPDWWFEGNKIPKYELELITL